MISFNTILNRLDTVFYLIVFAIIYVAIIYLWRKIAQLESSFYKLETTFATQLLYKNKETTADKVAEDIFLKVFDNKISNTQNTESIEPKVQEINDTPIPEEIKEEPIITEMSDALTSSVQDDNLSKSKLAKMSVEQLKEHCGSLHVSTEGTKTELINRILLQQK